MTAPHRRHDISDRVWELLEPHLPGRPRKKDGPAKDRQPVVPERGVLEPAHWGAPYQVRGRLWRDLPPDLGDRKNTHRCFCRWRDRGVWKDLLDTFIDEPDFEWWMIDSSHIKFHPDGTGARGGKQAIGRTKGG